MGVAIAQFAEAESKKEALNLQSKQNEIQYNQKRLQTLNILDNVIQHQQAQTTVRGTSFNSASFNAIQRNTENIASEELSNQNMQKSLFDRNIQVEKNKVNQTLFAQLFGDAMTAAEMAAGGA
ncbi:MAG: hypothetical protein RJA83_654 [Pseudomonadota bacterium]